MHQVSEHLQGPAEAALREIGANIRRARKEGLRMTREKFAEMLGCSPVTLDRIERGDAGVATIYLAAALQATHVLADMAKKSDPTLFIATQIPAEFPADFVAAQRG